MGMLERVLLMRVNLPPFEINYLFQRSNFLLNLSSILSQRLMELCLAPKGRPKYFIGSEPKRQSYSHARFYSFSTLLTGKMKLLLKLILRPDSASYQAKFQKDTSFDSLNPYRKPKVSSVNRR